MATLHRALILAAGAMLASCGGDDGTPVDAAVDASAAAEYQGLWLLTELVFDDGGTPITVRRDGVTQALRGDAQFDATGAATGRLQVRQLLLASGLPASAVMSTTHDVVVEPGRWVLTDVASGDVTVFTTALTGDHLVLTHDAADPRDTAANPPRSVTVDRVAPWSTTMVGQWDLVSITFGGTTVIADSCYAPMPSTWVRMTMAITIDARLGFERVMTMRIFSDDTCTTQVDTTSSTQLGMAEEEGGLHARIWGVENDRREYQAFDLSHAGSDLVLTRTACLPSPDCDTTAPTEVVVRARP